ncbi:MAG: sigma-70 family RNA polymerase sigma factor [Ktedonobacteraceae bacterium]|nr:sigma-70 family RNA polymerase sigma factor [Ktedonobacteraceae bacterium]
MERVGVPASACDRNGDVVTYGSVVSCPVLPVYATDAFWKAVEAGDTPLEMLVRFLRMAVDYEDDQARNTIFSTIILRIQQSNEYWAAGVLRMLSVLPDEREALLCDLCADLYESLLRALVDGRRTFWEENFLHALQFERRHVYQAFMMREGRWSDRGVKHGARIPRALVTRLDQPLQQNDENTCVLEIEDEQAHGMLLAIETSDMLRLVLLLPVKLKAVVLLLFWEGRSEKETAQVLGITDRTVRNRRREALKLLREALDLEEEQSS